MLRPTSKRVELADICRAIGLAPLPGSVSGITHDSREVVPGDLFAALPGARWHGAQFAAGVIAAGAAGILTDPAGAEQIGACAVPVLVVDDPRAALGAVSAVVYGGSLPLLVGVTGTNGKTTTTHCVQAVLEAASRPTAVIGTLGLRFGGLSSYSGRTTPEAPEVHAALAALAEAGAHAVAMEVSSHALSLGRVDGIRFDVAVFLNLTQDHLDFHHTMEHYFEAKADLFTARRARFAVINIDDEWGRRLCERCEVPFETYSTTGAADWTAAEVEATADGRTRFTAVGPRGPHRVTLSMPGDFNVANALAALAVAEHLGVDLATGLTGLATVAVPGRLEYIANPRGIAAYADYAHTPDAVERVLRVARGATAGRVITVMGCGGDRDPLKRPLMGRIAALASDRLIVTDDNPRTEPPADIRAQVLSGIDDLDGVVEIGDRAAAIDAAVAMAQPGDCVLVLGKGHETGQEVHGVVHPFDDRDSLRRALGVTA